VRCLDLDPFEPLGITAQTMRFLDVFLLHCLLTPSPPDTPAETAALARNQLRAAESGRAPGLKLERPDGRGEETLEDWGHRILDRCQPLAAALDAVHGGTRHAEAVANAISSLHDPDHSPSAHVLAATRADFGGSFTAFARAQSEQALERILQWDWTEAQAAHFRQLAQASLQEQRAREAADTMSFEDYRRQYLAQL
jgi:glutamate--cysteine ligase